MMRTIQSNIRINPSVTRLSCVMCGLPLCFQPPARCQSATGYSHAYTYQNITDKACTGGDVRIVKYMSPWRPALQCEGLRSRIYQR